MTERTPEAARIDRLFLIAFVPVVILMLVSLAVRMRSDTDPLWTEFATPLFFILLGLRGLVVPAPPATRKFNRAMGVLLLVCGVLIFLLNVIDFQGAA